MRNVFTALSLVLASAVGLGGCAYKSMYNQTNFDVEPKRVPANVVKVVKSPDDLVSQYTELGRYRGRAPTVTEAMTSAKDWCGEAGGNVYVLNSEPAQGSFGYWNIDGMCSLLDPSTTPAADEPTLGGKNKKGKKKKKGGKNKKNAKKNTKKNGGKNKKKNKKA